MNAYYGQADNLYYFCRHVIMMKGRRGYLQALLVKRDARVESGQEPKCLGDEDGQRGQEEQPGQIQPAPVEQEHIQRDQNS